MTGRERRGEFRRYIESDGNREDLYFSVRTSTLMGVVMLAAGLVFGIEFLLLSGVIMVAIGLVLFMFLLDDYLGWRAYHRKPARPSVTGVWNKSSQSRAGIGSERDHVRRRWVPHSFLCGRVSSPSSTPDGSGRGPGLRVRRECRLSPLRIPGPSRRFLPCGRSR